MNIAATITDNITEVLTKILEFTKQRHKILTENVVNVNVVNYLPKELDSDGFADVMGHAVFEHMKNERLLLRDNNNIKFGANGSVEIKSIHDAQAGSLLKINKEKYLKLQIKKISDNLLNRKVTEKLLRKKRTQQSLALNSQVSN